MGTKKTGAVPSTELSRKTTASIVYAQGDGRYAAELARELSNHGVAAESDVGRSWIHAIRGSSRIPDVLIFLATPEALRATAIAAKLSILTTVINVISIVFDRDDTAKMPSSLLRRGTVLFARSGVDASDLATSLLPHLPRARSGTGVVTPRPSIASRPLNEGKLILVGRGEVGKTSLVKRLVRNTFSGDESKTQGINITSWPLRCGTTTFRLNIWDFGGQEIMHATHQFFLTERSLYLLVLNGREGGEDIDAEYWLKHIESFGGESPVIVVQNKISQHPFDLNYRGLRARYPQIRDFVKTDCSDKTGINELRAAIRKVVHEMPEIGMDFPSDWFSVKERLETMNDEFMSYERFRQMCRDEDVTDDVDRDKLAAVLHCLGIALNYRDDARLRETSVLRPEWVTQGIYKILNAPKLAERQGELHLDDLREILLRIAIPSTSTSSFWS